jgi:hypothetical protein
MSWPFDHATIEELLAEALGSWRGASESIHDERCIHPGGIEVCDPDVAAAERRAAQLGVAPGGRHRR